MGNKNQKPVMHVVEEKEAKDLKVLAGLYKTLTGREPTAQELEDAQKRLGSELKMKLINILAPPADIEKAEGVTASVAVDNMRSYGYLNENGEMIYPLPTPEQIAGVKASVAEENAADKALVDSFKALAKADPKFAKIW